MGITESAGTPNGIPGGVNCIRFRGSCNSTSGNATVGQIRLRQNESLIYLTVERLR